MEGNSCRWHSGGTTIDDDAESQGETDENHDRCAAAMDRARTDTSRQAAGPLQESRTTKGATARAIGLAERHLELTEPPQIYGAMPMFKAYLDALIKRHRELDDAIARRLPEAPDVRMLKRQKLRLKDHITHVRMRSARQGV
ncbi:YdcH family protein [Sphingobium algorifonticola]|nr:YdcH family protein [Sphingobium algorifonticola]